MLKAKETYFTFNKISPQMLIILKVQSKMMFEKEKGLQPKSCGKQRAH